MSKKKHAHVPAPKPDTTAEPLSGRCPVCTEILEEEGEYYQCSDHYKIIKESFHIAWQTYIATMSDVHDMSGQTDAGLLLMNMLLDTNVAENKPTLKNILEIEHARDQNS